jgi:hypothetical protein
MQEELKMVLNTQLDTDQLINLPLMLQVQVTTTLIITKLSLEQELQALAHRRETDYRTAV